MCIRDSLNVIALLVLNGLGYVGYGVVQRMFQQVVSVIALSLIHIFM